MHTDYIQECSMKIKTQIPPSFWRDRNKKIVEDRCIKILEDKLWSYIENTLVNPIYWQIRQVRIRRRHLEANET